MPGRLFTWTTLNLSTRDIRRFGTMNRKVPTIFRRGVSMVELNSQPAEVSASAIRKSFIDFFCQDNDHFYIPSSPVFSLLDPTLAFVNAGMNQFKNVFLGSIQPASNRVANSQKCIRVGGKHNDLSQVGQDGTHHSFFEMLGNWSFGDYFKKEACTMSWNLLVSVYNIPPERLYFTYFGGDESLGLKPDFEVREIWRELGVKENHILPFDTKHNFWEMGNTGPCGVCTEIHYDHIPGRKDAGHLVNANGGEISELWNLVFTQFNRKKDGSLEQLDRHFVDTGMGYERLVAVLQGKTSNYDTDLFMPLFKAIQNYTGHYVGYQGKYGEGEIDCDYRVLADHSRMIAVALTDGMIPNQQNKVRTIIRRALAVCENSFKSDYKLLTEVVNRVAESLSCAYPQIERNLAKARHIIQEEDEIWKTLQENASKVWKKYAAKYPKMDVSDVMEAPNLIQGLEYVNKSLESSRDGCLSPQVSWVLFDTYGISPKIIQKLALNLGLKFDPAAFEDYLVKIKKTMKKDQEKKINIHIMDNIEPETLYGLTKLRLEPSKDHFRYDYIVDGNGRYMFPEQSATVQAIIKDNQIVDSLSGKNFDEVKGSRIGLVLDRTQFFSSDSNRQSDTGTFSLPNGIVLNVENVVKVKQSVIHFGTFTSFPGDAELSIYEEGILRLDEDRRLKMMRDYTALNLVKAGIRQQIEVIGEKRWMISPCTSSLTLMIYKKRPDLNGIIELEKFINQIILHDVCVLRKPLNHSQFYKMDDVAFYPGVDLVESEIPVFEVNSGFTLIREHCTGPHVLRTSHLKDFLIMDYRNVGFCLYDIKFVTGPTAVAVRKADGQIRQRWTALSQSVNLNDLNHQEKLKNLKTFIKELSKSTDYSYATKSKILNDVKVVEANLKVAMKKASQSSA